MTTRAPALPAQARRATIIAATLPLFLERVANISSRQITGVAGIAARMLVCVSSDKEPVVLAALRSAFDPEPIARDRGNRTFAPV
jgi:hypothetical protein